jgi:hypothetical protein
MHECSSTQRQPSKGKQIAHSNRQQPHAAGARSQPSCPADTQHIYQTYDAHMESRDASSTQTPGTPENILSRCSNAVPIPLANNATQPGLHARRTRPATAGGRCATARQRITTGRVHCCTRQPPHCHQPALPNTATSLVHASARLQTGPQNRPGLQDTAPLALLCTSAAHSHQSPPQLTATAKFNSK